MIAGRQLCPKVPAATHGRLSVSIHDHWPADLNPSATVPFMQSGTNTRSRARSLRDRDLSFQRVLFRLIDSIWSNTFVYNRWRRRYPRHPLILRLILLPITRLGLLCGFPNIDYAYVHGRVRRLHIGQRCSTMNTTFNVVSGDVYIGDDTLFSHNCYVLTGIHRFYNGKRASLQADSPIAEVPLEGRDIRIGNGCFIGAGATIIGGVTIGDNVIIGAGAVVTSDVPTGSFVAGVPARVMKSS
jgi:acetyltransferase-like isoleucine patch superfamily enzyme